MFDERESELEMKNYAEQWYPRRKIMLRESLARLFLANITPPLIGFDSLEEFILHKEKITAIRQEHRFKQILEEMEQEKNVSNGQV